MRLVATSEGWASADPPVPIALLPDDLVLGLIKPELDALRDSVRPAMSFVTVKH